ncbi:MAG: tetratricopeptide repeat protein, partial [Bradymonadaceae bacterium]
RARAAVQTTLAELLRARGDLEQAQSFYEKALRTAHELEDSFMISGGLLGLGMVAMERGDFEEALELVERSRALREQLGNLNALTSCVLNLAYIHRHQGTTERAEALFLEGLGLAQKLRLSHHVMLAHQNLGLVRIAQGRHLAAIEDLDEALEQARASKKSGYTLSCHISLLLPLASTAQWLIWDHHLARVLSMWTDTMPYPQNMLELLEATILLCDEASQPERSQCIRTLSERLRNAINDQDSTEV